jgi:hypothetical protein
MNEFLHYFAFFSLLIFVSSTYKVKLVDIIHV